jgi:hypothetical protein
LLYRGHVTVGSTAKAWERGEPGRVSIDRVRHFLRELEFEDRATIKPGEMEIVAPSRAWNSTLASHLLGAIRQTDKRVMKRSKEARQAHKKRQQD